MQAIGKICARMLRRGGAATFVLACLTAASQANYVLYVNPSGKDTNTGLSPSLTAGSGGPVLTLSRALTLMEQHRQTGTPGFIWMAGGSYYVPGTINLSSNDSNLTIEAMPGAQPRLIGGVLLKTWSVITGSTVLRRLPAAARGSARMCNYLAAGAPDAGTLVRRYANWDNGQLSAMELFINKVPATLARYPKTGFDPVGVVSGSPLSFSYTDPVISNFKPNEVWTHGYWGNMGSDSHEFVTAINPSSKQITVASPGPYYPFASIGRFYMENVLEELSQPGDYFIDRTAHAVYCWLPSGTTEVLASTLNGPVLSLTGTSSVELNGLTVEVSRGSGIIVTGGSGNLVQSCIVRNTGRNGVEIQGGTNNGVSNCNISGVGEVGIIVNGGDRVNLVSASNYANNNQIEQYARWVRAYRPGITLGGVGNMANHNLIQNAPHQAIGLSGNNNTMSNNEIAQVCLETGDSGAIYIDRDVTQQGNLIEDNLFHDIPNPFTNDDYQNACVYLDDLTSGTTVSGNCFARVPVGILIGGGRNNTLTANSFYAANHPVYLDCRGETWAASYYATGGLFFQQIAAVNATGPIYTKAYPEFLTLLSQNYAACANNVISNSPLPNAWIYLADSLSANGYSTPGDLIGTNPMFSNPAALNFTLLPSSPAASLGLPQLTPAKVGPTTAVPASVPVIHP